MLRFLFFTLLAFTSSPTWAFQATDDPEADQYFGLGGDFAASHILVAYRKADKARPEVRRNKQQAAEKARELSRILQDHPERFEELALAESDGVSAKAYGSLDTFRKGTMDRVFELALIKLKVGEITTDPVKTPFGFHIIRRDSMLAKNYAAHALLLPHVEATQIRGLREEAEGPSRTRTESREMAERFRQDLKGASFREAADRHGDLRRNFLGVFKQGDNGFTDTAIEHIASLPYEGVSEVLDMSIGFVLFQRIKVVRRGGSQILISHLDSPNASEDMLRTPKEARALAEQLIAELQKNPSRFSKTARKYSDGPFAASGGKLPAWYRGYKPPKYETAIDQLGDGQMALEPIDTVDGFYILKRDKL